MSALLQFPSAPPTMPAVARIMARYDRAKLAAFIAVAIDLLDTLDGDPEAEELPLEDAFVQHDPHFAEQEEGGKDASFVEWHTKHGNLRRKGQAEILPTQNEDDEEDDPSGQCDEDGINTLLGLSTGSGPGCTMSDPDCEHDGREIDDDGW